MKTANSEDYTLTPLSGNEYTSCLCGSERKTLSWTMLPSVIGRHLWVLVIAESIIKLLKILVLFTFAGVVSVTVTAEAVASHASCDNEIVSVPERGRIDTVTRSLIVKVKTHQPGDMWDMLSWRCEHSCVIIFFFISGRGDGDDKNTQLAAVSKRSVRLTSRYRLHSAPCWRAVVQE